MRPPRSVFPHKERMGAQNNRETHCKWREKRNKMNAELNHSSSSNPAKRKIFFARTTMRERRECSEPITRQDCKRGGRYKPRRCNAWACHSEIALPHRDEIPARCACGTIVPRALFQPVLLFAPESRQGRLGAAFLE